MNTAELTEIMNKVSQTAETKQSTFNAERQTRPSSIFDLTALTGLEVAFPCECVVFSSSVKDSSMSLAALRRLWWPQRNIGL